MPLRGPTQKTGLPHEEEREIKRNTTRLWDLQHDNYEVHERCQTQMMFCCEMGYIIKLAAPRKSPL